MKLTLTVSGLKSVAECNAAASYLLMMLSAAGAKVNADRDIEIDVFETSRRDIADKKRILPDQVIQRRSVSGGELKTGRG